MLRLIILTLVVGLCGCTTLRPVEGDPSEIRAGIASGDLVSAGDRVRVETRDGERVEIDIIEITDLAIVGRTDEGDEVSVPIDQVTSVHTERATSKRSMTIGAVIVVIAVAALAGGGGGGGGY